MTKQHPSQGTYTVNLALCSHMLKIPREVHLPSKKQTWENSDHSNLCFPYLQKHLNRSSLKHTVQHCRALKSSLIQALFANNPHH